MQDIKVTTSGDSAQVTVGRLLQMTVSGPESATIFIPSDWVDVTLSEDGKTVEIRTKERYAFMAPEVRRELQMELAEKGLPYD